MKKIFYTCSLLLTSLIISINAQSLKSSEAERIIYEDGKVFMSPVWSPDGSMIAFTEENYSGIYVRNLQENSIKQITDEPAAGFVIKWSQNSENILTRVARFEGARRYNAVKIFNVMTGEEKQLSEYRTMMPGIPEWTNGDEDVFIYNTEKLEIFPTGLTSSDTQTTDQIIYKRNNKIAVENLAAESINIYEPVQDSEILNLIVSPDGRKAAFEIIGSDMYLMNIDGTGLTNLGKGYRPSWSPDNNYLVYMITEDDGHRILSSDLYSIKIDGTEKTNLTNTSDNLEMNPDWSPDGKKIAYDVLDEGAIYLMVIGE